MTLNILDYTPTLAKVPLRRGYTILPDRAPESFITFHYSAVQYPDRSHNAELQTLYKECVYQMDKNWGSVSDPAFIDGLAYDYTVLSDGTIVQTRKKRQQLWHCGNQIGNARSWSVHVMLGGSQDLTTAQRSGLFLLFDDLRSRSNIPRANVVGHCEWPRVNGLPVRSTFYSPQPGQSLCPGSILIKHVYDYRNAQSEPSKMWYVKTIVDTNIRTEPRRSPYNVVRVIPNGVVIGIDKSLSGESISGNDVWYHYATGEGFAHSSCFESVK
jgi:hypothetical protein